MKKKDKIKKAINEIKFIQSTEWSSINAANVKIKKVEELNLILDELGYKGIRPPKRWEQLPDKFYNKKSSS